MVFGLDCWDSAVFFLLAAVLFQADPYALEFVDASEGHDAKVPEYDDYSRAAWHGNYTWTDQASHWDAATCWCSHVLFALLRCMYGIYRYWTSTYIIFSYTHRSFTGYNTMIEHIWYNSQSCQCDVKSIYLLSPSQIEYSGCRNGWRRGLPNLAGRLGAPSLCPSMRRAWGFQSFTTQEMYRNYRKNINLLKIYISYGHFCLHFWS